MPAPIFFDQFADALASGVHDFDGDTFKIALTTSVIAANNGSGYYTELTGVEVANSNGYLTGGEEVLNTAANQSDNTTSVVGDDVSWEASGGAIGPFQYAVLYNDSASNKEVICYWNKGSSSSVSDTGTFTVVFTGTIIHIAPI